jgi:hypothetical protein
MINQWKLRRKTINSEMLHFVLLSIFWSVHIFKYSYAKVHLSRTSNQILWIPTTKKRYCIVWVHYIYYGYGHWWCNEKTVLNYNYVLLVDNIANKFWLYLDQRCEVRQHYTIPTKRGGPMQSRHHHHFTQYNLFLPWYSLFGVNKNHLYTRSILYK